MASDIVSGLFGMAPWQIQQQQGMMNRQDASQFARMPAAQRGVMGIYQGGQGLGELGAGMLGMENPAVAEAKAREAALSGLDMSSPESILQRAQQIQDPRLKMQLTILAQQKAAEIQAQKQASAKMQLDEARAERELAVAEKSLRGEPEMKYAPEIYKLIALRDSLPPGDPRRAEVDAAIRKSTYINEPKSVEEAEASKLRIAEAKQEAKQSAEQKKQSLADAKSFKWLDSKFKEIENTMADSLGIPPEALAEALTKNPGKSEKSLERAVGYIDAMFPALTQKKSNILSHINRLKALGETGGLAELRRAGVAPGSVTEREWPKFRADLGNIDESLDGKELLKQYLRIYQKIQDSRVSAKETISPESGQAWQAQTPEEVRELFKAETIDRETARAILKDMELRRGR